jgi:hypothetical protein
MRWIINSMYRYTAHNIQAARSCLAITCTSDFVDSAGKDAKVYMKRTQLILT